MTHLVPIQVSVSVHVILSPNLFDELDGLLVAFECLGDLLSVIRDLDLPILLVLQEHIPRQIAILGCRWNRNVEMVAKRRDQFVKAQRCRAILINLRKPLFELLAGH